MESGLVYNMSLCSSCQQFDIHFLSQAEFPWKNIPSKAILKAVQEGCPFCCLLVDSLGEGSRKRMARSSWVRLYFDMPKQTPSAGTEAVKGDASLGVRWLRVKVCSTLGPLPMAERDVDSILHVAADEGTPAATSGDVLGRYTDDSDPLSCMHLIKNWWLSCERERQYHPRCSRRLSGGRIIDPDRTRLPKRCVRVIPLSVDVADPTQYRLKLKLENTEGNHGQYICLSHRWVQPETRLSSTTKSNHGARLSGEGFGQLPPLFLHTFRAAAKFGIRYVWIDSLCIIQDSPDDWDQESAKMGQYYQLAAFTLTSTFPPEDTASFAGYSPPTPEMIARLPYRDKGGVPRGHFYVYPRASRSLLAAKWASDIGNSQLLARGWIFQEWLLSRRIVCLTPSGVYMQCQCRDQAAAQNQYGEDVGWFPALPVCRGFLSIKASLRLCFDGVSDIYSSWESVVENYSGLTLSETEKDRISALAGVAGEFAAALASHTNRAARATFIAGLWTGDIHRGLLWSQASPGRHRRLDGFPSWSWPSIDVAVRWPLRVWTPNRIDRSFEMSGLVSATPEWTRRFAEANVSVNAAIVSRGCRLQPLGSQLPVAPGVVASRNATAIVLASQLISGIVLCVNVLDLRGRLQPVFIGNYWNKWRSNLGYGPETGEATTTTAETAIPKQYMYRTVSIPGTRPLISGWASLEHPDFQDDDLLPPSPSPSPCPPAPSPSPSIPKSLNNSNTLTKPPQPIIYALLISTQGTHLGGRQGPDFAPWTEQEFNVLYLRSCLNQTRLLLNAYERIGVGTLFGEYARQGFDLATERQVQLI